MTDTKSSVPTKTQLFGGSIFYIFAIFLIMAMHTACGSATPPSSSPSDNTPADEIGRAIEILRGAIDDGLPDWEVQIHDRESTELIPRPWRTVELTHTTKSPKVVYRRSISVPEVFAGERVKPGKAELVLHFRGPGDFTGEVLVDGEHRAAIPTYDPETRAVDIPPVLIAEKADPGATYEVEIVALNSLVYPPYNNRGTAKTIRFFSANLKLEQSATAMARVNELVVNLESGDKLTRPWQPPVDAKGRVFHPPIENRSKRAPKKLNRLRDHLRDGVLELDLTALLDGDTAEFNSSVERFFAKTKDLSEYAKSFTVFVVGNAHIDLAWLWRVGESVEVSANTYQSVLNNQKEFPWLVYTQSQAQTFDWVERHRPELLKAVQEEVKNGRWDIVGGMWAEPDCNMPSGESFVRQFLYGQGYFFEKFGQLPSLGWNPDSFGYNWNLPQLFTKAGIDAFITQKIKWNDTTIFPYHLFWWEGPDGTRILTYLPPGTYTESINPHSMMDQLLRFEHTTGFNEVLVLFGLGNHGGGPNRPMLERAEMLKNQPLYPQLKPLKAHDYLALLKQKDLSDIPIWKSELYLETHRGTLTTQSDTKRNNRRSESLIETVEKAASFAGLYGHPYPTKELAAAWKTILLNQFHDILPGSSITPVYRDSAKSYGKVMEKLEVELEKSLATLADEAGGAKNSISTLMVFNPLSWERRETAQVELPQDFPEKVFVRGPDKKPVMSQVVLDEQNNGRTLFFQATAPALGYATYSIHEGSPPRFDSKLKATRLTLANEFLAVKIDPQTGNLASVYDKVNGKEALSGPGGRLQVFENLPKRWDAWNIGYTDKSWSLDQTDSVELLESGPLRAVIRIKKSHLGLSKSNWAPTEGFPSSFFIQDITLEAGSDRLDIHMSMDWWEDHSLLKIKFPVAVKSDHAEFEIPYATISRSTENGTPAKKAQYEVAVHRWADLSDGDFGVALLNDSKYGMDAKEGILGLSLLTSPMWPDPIADRGDHRTMMALLPHAGDWKKAKLYRRGQELNLPLTTYLVKTSSPKKPRARAFMEVEGDHAVVSALKQAEDGDGHIIRVVESAGRGGLVKIRLPKKPASAIYVNLLEKEIGPAKLANDKLIVDLKPFEIVSIRVKLR